MLNISRNRVLGKLHRSRYSSLQRVESKVSPNVLLRLLMIFFGVGLIMMFVPWTQNINARGGVTTLRPDQRPQTINSVIAGRIEKWYVQEGDIVEKGDTIVFISEIKDEYFDPELLDRTQEQIKSKELSVSSYMEKVKALDNQIDGLAIQNKLEQQKGRNKLQQAKLKVVSDSIDLKAASIKFKTADQQYERYRKLHADGLKSTTELENRELTMQKALAEKISAENKLLSSRNAAINANIELGAIATKYRNEIAKAESQKFTAMSSMYDAEAVVTKMQNQYTNYSVRTGMYYITAPQNGYITRTIPTGIGETIKEGDEIMSIMPTGYDLAIEMYINPVDLPLIEKNQHVRIQFDGWPAIVFSGWPNTSYGTYGGLVYAVDNYISENGKYRILVSPDPNDHPWPDALRVGAGTSNMLLLKDVPIWYELWRKINGFPPDFYKQSEQQPKKPKS